MRYYHNVPTGCAPKWEQISKTNFSRNAPTFGASAGDGLPALMMADQNNTF